MTVAISGGLAALAFLAVIVAACALVFWPVWVLLDWAIARALECRYGPQRRTLEAIGAAGCMGEEDCDCDLCIARESVAGGAR